MTIEANPLKELLSWLVMPLPKAASIQVMLNQFDTRWRNEMTDNITWGIPCAEVIEYMRAYQNSPSRLIYEMAAGTGYYSAVCRNNGLLMEASGTKRKSYPCNDHFGHFSPMKELGAVAVARWSQGHDLLLVWGDLHDEISTKVIDWMTPGQRIFIQGRRDVAQYEPWLLHLNQHCETLCEIEAPHWKPYTDLFSAHVKR